MQNPVRCTLAALALLVHAGAWSVSPVTSEDWAGASVRPATGAAAVPPPASPLQTTGPLGAPGQAASAQHGAIRFTMPVLPRVEGCNAAGGLKKITSSDEPGSAQYWCGTPPVCLTLAPGAFDGASHRCTIVQFARREPRYDPNGRPGANPVREPQDLVCEAGQRAGNQPLGNGRCPPVADAPGCEASGTCPQEEKTARADTPEPSCQELGSCQQDQAQDQDPVEGGEPQPTCEQLGNCLKAEILLLVDCKERGDCAPTPTCEEQGNCPPVTCQERGDCPTVAGDQPDPDLVATSDLGRLFKSTTPNVFEGRLEDLYQDPLFLDLFDHDSIIRIRR